MSITAVEHPPITAPRASTGAPPPEPLGHLTLLGDLTCPWSHLASRRAAVLERDGVTVDWWMVEHDRPAPGRPVPQRQLRQTVVQDLAEIATYLLPGERLPEVPDRVPSTGPAVSGYAEAWLAGVGPTARRLLFEALWSHAADLSSPRLVRTLLADVVRGSASPSELVRDWGYAVDVTGSPVTGDADRLVRRWRSAWSAAGGVVPVMVASGRRWYGVEVIGRLADEILLRGLDPAGGEEPGIRDVRDHAGAVPTDLADLSWATQHGNRWLRTRREALSLPVLERLRPWV